MNFYDTTDDGGTSFRNLIKYAKRIFSSHCKVTVTLRSNDPLIQQAVFSRQVFKDDVHCFSSTSDICFMGLCYYCIHTCERLNTALNTAAFYL
jgi:hypothetical protein